ncbi:hypothetical protein [Streptomyces bobili]|uniref:hypothetical protein n=1 Tax=Streptomyces bobili TaxID=67280 RepID=UPI000A3B4B51|nr:hypothetical protein [Streptomyces bobili]
MSFPQDPLGLRGHLLLGGVWKDITPDLYTRDPITHTRGRAYRATAADPTTGTATIKNRDGRYSTRNAEGPYYGQLTRNTAFKATVPGGDSAHLELTGGLDRATTPDTAVLDITGSIDIRAEIKLDNATRSQAIVLCGKWLTTGDQRSWLLGLSAAGGLHFRRSLTGTGGYQFFESAALPTTATGRIAVRTTWNATNNQYTHYWADTIAGPWTPLATSITGSATTLPATSAPLTIGDIDQFTELARPDGNIYKVQVRNGIDGTLVAGVDFTAQAGGATSFTDTTGLVWTLAGAALLTDRMTRFNLEVPEWPTRWSTSEADAWASIEGSGILRRLSQGQKPLDSSLRRRLPSGGPLAYWPMEDGSSATQFYSPILAVRPMATTGMQLAADDSLPGSNALATIQGAATLSGTVPAPAVGPTQWHTEFIFKTSSASGPVAARTLLQWHSTGTVRRWRLMLVAGGCELYGYDVEDVVVTSSLIGLSTQVYGVWCRWQMWAVQNGSNVDWSYRFVPIGGVGSGVVTTSYAGTIGRISAVSSPTGGYSTDLNGTAIGHLGVFPTPNTGIYNSADTGFDGETAATRMQRLCAEERVPIRVIGTAASTEQVGPQRPAALLDLLREAAEVDGGVFGDSLTRGLQYRTRASLYNQAPKITLDYAARQIAPPLEPGEDDQARNEWSITREGGSTGLASLETGPLSIADIGYYPDSKTLALFSDDQTGQHAGWELHLTTWNEARYPAVTLRLHRHPEFIPAVLALDVGDKIRLINLPKRFAGGGTVELLVDSWEETLLPRTWEITFNCAPAGPWSVAELALAEDFEDTTFEVPWTNGGSLPWARSSAQAHTGTWSLKSGAITNNQTSDAVFAVPTGKTELRFWYWTSSEASGPGFEGDRLLVSVDGVQVLRAQGTTPWTQAVIDVTGKSTVTFRYAKDNSTAVGSDSAHIDNVSFTGRGPTRLNTDGSKLLTAATDTATQLLVGSSPGPQWTMNPAQFPFNVLAGGEEMRATGATSWARDAFGRTASGGWGTADTGQAWTVVGGTVATDFAVGSGYGQHVLTTVNASRRCGINHAFPDVDVIVSVTTSATATGGSLYGGPLARYVDADNLYMARIEFTSGNAILLDVRKRVAAVETSIGTYATSLTHVAGTNVRCRLQVIGSVVRAKVWPAGSVEPIDWQVDLVDTSITTSVFVGARSISAAGNTNVNPVIRYDDFEVLNPQLMTVVRSVNGVVKPHAADTAVGLAQPAHLAL